VPSNLPNLLDRLTPAHTFLVGKTMERGLLRQQQSALLQEQADLKQREEDQITARSLLQSAAQEVQGLLKFRLTNLVTTCFSTMMEEPYEMGLEFDTARGYSEANLSFLRDGNQFDPMSSTGGGPVDVASFGLRISLYGINPNRPSFFLDEPFRCLDEADFPQLVSLLQSISKRLGIQMIIVTHLKGLMDAADITFVAQRINRTSTLRAFPKGSPTVLQPPAAAVPRKRRTVPA
jgi:DNA repair exonuclease SbcCD ATPase subunit